MWLILRHFPAISFFKAGSMMIYPGDVMETEAVIEFLTNEDALELPDKIEEVDNENLFRYYCLVYLSNIWILFIKLECWRRRSTWQSCSMRRRRGTAWRPCSTWRWSMTRLISLESGEIVQRCTKNHKSLYCILLNFYVNSIFLDFWIKINLNVFTY